MKDITVLIIDEHAQVGERLARALSAIAGFRVVAHTANPVWAAEFAHHWTPNVIIADFKRGPRPRAEMVAWIKRNSPGSIVVVNSAFYSQGERDEFHEAGAALCLLKGLSSRQLALQLHKAVLNAARHVEVAV